jgi:hypothetical protein
VLRIGAINGLIFVELVVGMACDGGSELLTCAYISFAVSLVSVAAIDAKMSVMTCGLQVRSFAHSCSDTLTSSVIIFLHISELLV